MPGGKAEAGASSPMTDVKPTSAAEADSSLSSPWRKKDCRVAEWSGPNEGQHKGQCLILPDDRGLMLRGQLEDAVSVPTEFEVLGLKSLRHTSVSTELICCNGLWVKTAGRGRHAREEGLRLSGPTS